MNKQIDTIKKVRVALLEVIKDLSIDQLNKVPAGFNNNIIWNLGHLIAAQQGVCYARAGLKQPLDEQITAHYKPGTKPERSIDETEVQQIKQQLFSSLDKLQEDYDNTMFTNYTTFTTRYGAETVKY